MAAIVPALILAAATRSNDCTDGYIATGAGDTATNGCYNRVAGSETYMLDANHVLYSSVPLNFPPPFLKTAKLSWLSRIDVPVAEARTLTSGFTLGPSTYVICRLKMSC
jgi:hypothetical protein